jgi:hypothetical protein
MRGVIGFGVLDTTRENVTRISPRLVKLCSRLLKPRGFPSSSLHLDPLHQIATRPLQPFVLFRTYSSNYLHMSKQRTTRTNHRHSPTAASRTNKGTSAFVEDDGLNVIPYEIKETARRETKSPRKLGDVTSPYVADLSSYTRRNSRVAILNAANLQKLRMGSLPTL